MKSCRVSKINIKLFFLFNIIFNYGLLPAQEFYKINNTSIIFNNGYLTREISIGGDSVYSNLLLLSHTQTNLLAKSQEFSFTMNGDEINGFTGWQILSTSNIRETDGGEGLRLVLSSTTHPGLRIELNYILYPNLPIIRKWIKIENTGYEEFKIENLNVEDLQTTIGSTSAVVYHNYGRMKHLGSFEGDWDSPIIVLHDISRRGGIAIGNEAPGVLKRTAYHTVNNNIEAGLTHSDGDFPFRKWLKPGENWQSPKIFLCLYFDTDDGFKVINNDVNDFMIKHMRPRIVEAREKPYFVYNTWNPFRRSINDSLIYEVAKAAADCGVQEFVIDDGWQINMGSGKAMFAPLGDWNVDQAKFPDGLSPVFEYIRSLGMKPGLWISVGTATLDAKVFQDHPEWFIRNKENEIDQLHSKNPRDWVTACLGTDWVDFIKNAILRLVKDHGLAYVKLDLSILTSAYTRIMRSHLLSFTKDCFNYLMNCTRMPLSFSLIVLSRQWGNCN